MEPFFLNTDLRSDAHQSQIIGGDADEYHTQIVGGVYSQIIGGDQSPIPPCFGTTVLGFNVSTQAMILKRFCQLIREISGEY